MHTDKLKSKVTSKFSSRSHKRYRNYSLNELAKAEVEVSHHDYSNEEEESSDEYDDEDLSSIGSEDEYLLSTVEDQSVAVGLMPDGESWNERYHVMCMHNVIGLFHGKKVCHQRGMYKFKNRGSNDLDSQ